MKRIMRIEIILILAGVVFLTAPFLLRQKDKERSKQYIQIFEEDKKHEEKTKNDNKKKTSLLSEESVIGIIEIPDLKLKYPIFEGTGNIQLNDGIGHMSDTADLCEKGNCVLAGHNGSSRGVYFTHLSNIQIGSEVVITNKEKITHPYTVKEMKVVNPYDDCVTEQTEVETLTLFTCADHGKNRFVVKCEPKITIPNNIGENKEIKK